MKNEDNYEPDAGECISETAQTICKLATERGVPISAKFNDIELIAQPGDETGAIERAFWQESRLRHKRRHDEWKETAMDDQDILYWMEEHLDDLTITRDAKKGRNIVLGWYSKQAGCQVEVHGSRLREVVRLAAEQDEL